MYPSREWTRDEKELIATVARSIGGTKNSYTLFDALGGKRINDVDLEYLEETSYYQAPETGIHKATVLVSEVYIMSDDDYKYARVKQQYVLNGETNF